MCKDKVIENVREVATHLEQRDPESRYKISVSDTSVEVQCEWIGAQSSSTTGEIVEDWVQVWAIALHSGGYFEVTYEPSESVVWADMVYFLGLVVIS